MSVFVEEAITDGQGNIALTVPQGHTWRLLSFVVSISAGETVGLFYDAPGSATFYAVRGITGTEGDISFGIGAPLIQSAAINNTPLPNILLPSGSIIQLQVGSVGQTVFFLIED